MTIGTETTGNRMITAYFEDRAAATRAAERLVAAGIPEDSVRLTGDGATDARDQRSGGFFEALADLFLPDDDRSTYAEGLSRGGYIVSVRVSETRYEYALDILDDEGTIDIGERESSWRSEGWTGTRGSYADSATAGSTGYGSTGYGSSATAATGTGYGSTDGLAGREEAIPVVEERLTVGKRDVHNGRVRVRSYVIEEPVHESVTLRQEHVDVERRAVDRPAGAAEDLFRERTIELEERGEEAVVAKDARVTEELVLRKDATQRTEQIDDTVRKTRVEVEDERGIATDPLTRRG